MCMPMVYSFIWDQSLMIGWRKKSWNPARARVWRVCVCTRTTHLLITFFYLRKLFVCLNDPWEMRKKPFYFSSKIHSLRFKLAFFSLCNTSKVLLSSFWSQLLFFYLGMWNLGREDLAQIEIKDIFFRLKGYFSVFMVIFLM